MKLHIGTPFVFLSRRGRLTRSFILLVICGAFVVAIRHGIWLELKLSIDGESYNLSTDYWKKLAVAGPAAQKESLKLSGANALIWKNFCQTSVQVLCYHPLFPKAPDVKTIVNSLEVSRYERHYAQRIFGFLHPPETGYYKFALASDDVSELWLSPSDYPENAVLICSLSKRTTRDNFQHSPSQVSNEIQLLKGHKYFIEIVHLQFGGPDFVRVAWSLPGMIRNKFETIPANSLSLFNNNSATDNNYNSVPDSPACKSRPSHVHSLETNTKSRPMYLSHDAVANVLPYCAYEPSYLTIKEAPVGPKRNYYFLHGHGFIPIKSYPAVEYKTVVDHYPELANHSLDMKIAKEAAKKYVDALYQHHPGKFKVAELVNVERKVDRQLGSRFLLEFLINVTGKNEQAMLSESVFWPKGSKDLCYPKGFQWNRNAKLVLIITLKNQGRWMVHFLNNLEEIYSVTKDDKVSLVIFNFNSSDINLEQELTIRKLPPTKVVSHEAEHYSRTKSFNRAVEQVQDPKTIVFTLDLHLDLPSTIFDDIRKHCFENRSVYAPIIIRLGCGKSPETLEGRWEPMGFGLVGVYKSDWDKVGGLNEKAFDEKWGGEDWDFMERIVYSGMEYDRLRHPNIFHYFHSKKGMWDNE